MKVVTHLPCPDCGSSDALTDYGDHTYCFRCETHKSSGGAMEESMGNIIPLSDLDYLRLAKRHIRPSTCRLMRYGVYNNKLQVASYFHENKLVYQKTRDADKKFSVLKADDTLGVSLKNLLFGRGVWGDCGGKALILTEGEIDCLTAVEALGSSGIHACSLPSGSSSTKACITSNYEFINNYRQIYLCFDNDEPGRKATEEAIEILGASNILLFNLGDYKDLNDLWIAQGNTGVLRGFQNSKEYRPTGIVTGEDLWNEVNREETYGTPFPWESFNKYTYGIRLHEMLILTAGSGIGKTTVFKSIEAHCITQGLKLGIIHIEEQIGKTIRDLMSLVDGKDYSAGVSKEAFDSFMEKSDVVFYDKRKGFEEETITKTLEYMVNGMGCNVIFLDHITAIVDQYNPGEINQRTRKLISNLGKGLSRLPYTLFMISHLRKADGKPHEEGGRVHLDDLLGASAIKQWADYVIAIERDNQAANELEKNRPVARFLKNRHKGEYAGKLVPLDYDKATGRVTEGVFYGQKTAGIHKKTKEDRVLPDF